MLTGLDLNLLTALDALLIERNVTRAGNRIGLSQPATSAALRRLRRYFDDPLLSRVGRQYRLTPLALELIEPMQALMSNLVDLIDRRSGFDPATAERTFTVQLSDYATHLLVRPMLARLALTGPNVDVRFLPLDLGVAGSEIVRSVDLLVVPTAADRTADLVGDCLPLFRDRWVVAVSDDHPELIDCVTIEQLSRLPSIQARLADNLATIGETALDDAQISRRVSVTVGHFVPALFLLRGTSQLTLTPERLGMMLQPLIGLRLLAPPIALPEIVECMWWHPTRAADPGHAWLRSTMADVAAQLPPLLNSVGSEANTLASRPFG